MKFCFISNPARTINGANAEFEAVVSNEIRDLMHFSWRTESGSEEIEQPSSEFLSELKSCSFVAILNRKVKEMVEQLLADAGISIKIRWLVVRELEQLPICKAHSQGKMQASAQVTGRKRSYSITARIRAIIALLPENYTQILEGKRSEILPERFENTIRTKLPTGPGVYYFLDKQRKPLYIGKAKNLRKRVISHFSSSEDILKLMRLNSLLSEIHFEETGSFIIAGLLEDHEIRHYWPPMNKAQKTTTNHYSVVVYSDRSGQKRLSVTLAGKLQDRISRFHSYPLAVSFLSGIMEEYHLKPEVSTLKVKSGSQGRQLTTDLDPVLNDFLFHRKVTIFRTKGRSVGETGFIVLENSMLAGFGFISDEQFHQSEPQELIRNLRRCRPSITTEKLLFAFTEGNGPDHSFNLKKGAIPSGTAPRFARALIFDFQE